MVRYSRFVLLAASLTLALSSAGCGDPPGTVVDDGKKLGNLKLVDSPKPQPGVDPSAAAKKIIADIGQMRQTANNLKCELSGYFVSATDGSVGSTMSNFAYQKPNSTSIYITKSSDSRKVGTKLVWMGGSKMAVHTKFLGFWVSVSIDVHDDRARDPRGYWVDQTGITALLNTLTDPRNQVTNQGSGTLDNFPIIKLGIVSPRSLKGVAREVFIIDTQRKLPMVREMYDAAGKMVYRVKMDKIVLNSSLPASTFKVDE